MNLKNQREDLLPEIKDWTSDHLHLKYTKNVRGQKFRIWFWFSPDNYKIIKIGFPAIFTLFLGMGFLYVYLNRWTIPAIFLAICTLFAFSSFVKTLWEYPSYKNTNMYEVHLKDYVEDNW